jgi:hypothetical protein
MKQLSTEFSLWNNPNFQNQFYQINCSILLKILLIKDQLLLEIAIFIICNKLFVLSLKWRIWLKHDESFWIGAVKVFSFSTSSKTWNILFVYLIDIHISLWPCYKRHKGLCLPKFTNMSPAMYLAHINIVDIHLSQCLLSVLRDQFVTLKDNVPQK